MRAPERVPDPLKQKFFHSNEGFEIEYAKLIHTKDDSDLTVKHLMDCTGEFTKLIALFCGNSLVIRQLRDGGMQAPFIFGDDLVVQDVDYLRSADEGFEIVVALNSEKLNVHPNCVALLSWNGAKLVLLRKLKIEEEISCLKVIADEPLMEQLHNLLHTRMASWPHIIAVGTHLAHCYLFHFQLADQSTENGQVPKTVKLTDGLRPFHSGPEFLYSYADPCTGSSVSKRIRLDAVHVTCISFIEKSRTVLVGFSFGGIVTISLTTTPTIDPLVYPCGAAVNFFATLEPDDDPRSHLWFFVAYGTTRAKPLQLALYEVGFPEEETLPLSERTWNKPVFSIRLVVPFHNSTRWISAQTLVRDRVELKSSDDSTRDSYRFGSEKDRSLVFFSYIGNDRHGSSLRGGLFDLNAYYYKRLVQIITHDGTAAQQCAFLSTVHPTPIAVEEDYKLVKSIVVDPNYITRFISNVTDAEQMFYPSTYEMHVVHVAGAKKCYQLKLPSLPNQLFSTICADLEMHMKDATSASTWLNALGFPKKDKLVGASEQYADVCSVLYALVSHQRGMSIVQFIKHSESTELRHLIASWIWEEVDRASKRMHETIEPLFARFSAPLSPAGQKSLAHVHDVFVSGVQILRELIIAGEREQDQTKEYITSLEAQRFATENLKSYSLIIQQLMRSKILPVAEDREIRLAMEKVIEERRAKASGHQLYIDKLVVRMKRKSPGEPFWSAEGPQWYPPALLNLLGPILLLNIPAKWKGQLLAYYLLDYTNCKKVTGVIPDSPFDLLDDVAKQMHGLLGMNKEEVLSVYKFWCADAGKPLSEREELERSSPRKCLSAEADIKHFMSIPRPLTSEEENKLQSLCNTVRYGDFAWQCYLAKCRRFEEFKELPVPSNEDNEFVLDYEQLIPVVRMLRRSKDSSPLSQASWPSEMKQAIENFERERRSSIGRYDAEIPLLSRGKTPKPLSRRQYAPDGLLSRKRQATFPLQRTISTPPQTSAETDKTTPVAKRALLDLSEDESVLLPKNIPANTLNTINDILRTPQARARAAAQAESQRKWTETTPEGEFQKPVPRSILKSAKGVVQGAASPSRNRLHFDLPSPTQSLHKSPTSTTQEHLEKMSQPNFDESLDYEEIYESSSATEECVEIEPEEFAPYISPSPSAETVETAATVEEPVDSLEKSIEVQDEDESDEGMEKNESSVVIVEAEEEAMDEQHTPEELTVPEQEGHKQSQEVIVNPIVELAEDQIDERSVEQQDEDEGIDDAENVSVPKIVSMAEEQQEEEEMTDNRGPVILISEQRSEEREEEEPAASERLSFIEQEEQDEEEEYPESASVAGKSASSYEIQDEDVQPTVNIVRYESVVERTPGTTTNTGDLNDSEGRVEHVTRSIKIQSQFDDDVELREVQDEYDEVATALASGDYAGSSREGIQSITSTDLNGDTSTGRIKLVDYSFHESTFESTPNPTTSKHSRTIEENEARQTLQFEDQNDDELEGIETSTDISPPRESSSESTVSPLPEPGKAKTSPAVRDSEAAQSKGFQKMLSPKHDDLPVVHESRGTSRASSPASVVSVSSHPSESDLPPEIHTKRRSSRKLQGTRTPPPATPTRHSQRLREKEAAHSPGKVTEEADQHHEDHGADTHVAGDSRSPSRKSEELPHLTMSLRSRTPHATTEDVVSHELPSQRKSPSRSRRAAKETELSALEGSSTPPQESSEGNIPETPATTRSLRPRTPSRTRADSISSTPGTRSRVSRRTSESSTSSEVTASTRKSPSRSARKRIPSPVEEEEPSIPPKSPSRRTPTRSTVAAGKSIPEPAGKARAARALQQKFETTKRGEDARTYFDTVLEKHRTVGTSGARGSRRRTRSDSEVAEVKPLKLKKMEVAEVIPEEDEETDVPATRGRRKAAMQQASGSAEVTTSATRSPARSKRASSVTIAETTPGRTRRTSGSSVSSVGTASTPKSPSRRGRPRNIETIPE
ncbi:unnamed protein product [Cylicocyclus nassatus]|uniref:ELYS beta-propeller domain-containing protein n=1 Tax=Cylicocyclus nassatus TaxID=53992 RepID=A0AA36DMV5_CYLNA|nr:unnamed protein product [Cylicocyclus nassatus]